VTTDSLGVLPHPAFEFGKRRLVPVRGVNDEPRYPQVEAGEGVPVGVGGCESVAERCEPDAITSCSRRVGRDMRRDYHRDQHTLRRRPDISVGFRTG
jgi:hypothetical protein